MEVSITSLPAHVMNALDAIWEGSIADSLESETLEFKEDPACAGRGKPHGNPQAALIEKLIDEAVCLANGDAGTGHIVVGIKDKIGGPEAFTGTTFDTEKSPRRSSTALAQIFVPRFMKFVIKIIGSSLSTSPRHSPYIHAPKGRLVNA
nr:ATP-binding protein [Corynebacterium diphtheriae]